MSSRQATRVDQAALVWLPVGAGGRVVVHTSAWWERVSALAERRRPAPLFHAALEARSGGVPFVIEMAPAWGPHPGERGVVKTGPVALRWLGRSRAFRYEVRCWPGGTIPDRRWAVGAAVTVTRDPVAVARIVDGVHCAPALPWGRRVAGTRDMWNSNSLVAWLLAHADLPTDQAPPLGGRAPGWDAGAYLAMTTSAA